MTLRPIAGFRMFGAALSGRRVAAPLRYRHRLRLWVDASRTGLMQMSHGARFDRDSEHWLEAPHHASLDFSTAFTVVLWRNPATQASERAYVAKSNYDLAGKRGWAIQNSGTTGQEHQVTVFLYGSAWASQTTTNAPRNWSMCTVVYDGSQGTAANRVKIYFDGVTTPAAVSTSGTLPASLASGQTAPLTLGTWGDATSATHGRFFDGSLACVYLYNGVRAGTFVEDMYGEGFPVPFAQLAPSLVAQCVAAYDLDETSGTRFDRAGANHLIEQGGTIARSNLVHRLRDRAGAIQFVAPLYCYAPHWVAASPLGGRPALYLGGLQWMVAGGPDQPLSLAENDLSGEFFVVNRPTHLSLANFAYGIMSFEKEAVADDNETYWLPLYYNNTFRYRGRTDGASPPVNDVVKIGGTMAVDTNFVQVVRGLGSGGAASFAARINGEAATIDGATLSSSHYNKWLAHFEGRDAICLGGENYGRETDLETAADGQAWPIQDRFRGYLAQFLLYGRTSAGGALNDTELLAVEKWCGA